MDERAYARYMADVAYFITRLEQDPNSKYFMPIALAYNKMEKYNESISICKAALSRFPSYSPIKTLLAEAHIYKGDPLTAKNLLFDVITDDPENYKALRLLGTIYKSSDETGEALKYFKAAYIRAPEDEELKRMIEEMGASVSPDDLFAEFMKKNENANWGKGEDKSYKDIRQHIRSAEVIMADLVSNTDIVDNETSGGFGGGNLISDDEFNKLMAGTVVKDEDDVLQEAEPVTMGYQAPAVNVDEEAESTVEDVEQIVQQSDVIEAVDTIIETSEDYSELTNLLEAKPEKETLPENFNNENNEASEGEVDNVLAALDFTAEARPKDDDVLAALDIASETLSENEEEIALEETSSDSGQEDENGLFILEESAQNEDEQQNKPLVELPKPYENNIEKNGDNEETDLFVLDEHMLEENDYSKKEMFETDKTVTETVVDIKEEAQIEPLPQILTDEKFSDEISDDNQSQEAPFTFLDDEAADNGKGDDELNDDIINMQSALDATSKEFINNENSLHTKAREAADDSILSEVESLTLDEEELSAFQKISSHKEKTGGGEPIKFQLSDMISDDVNEDDFESETPQISSHKEEPATSLGESAPFSQRDILDEIYSASNVSYGEKENADKEPVNKEKTKARLLKMQAKLEKLKKGQRI